MTEQTARNSLPESENQDRRLTTKPQTGTKGFQADHNALVMKNGQAPRLFLATNDRLVLDCRDCDGKDEIARRAQIGPVHIQVTMP